jgi:hypothetical protein
MSGNESHQATPPLPSHNARAGWLVLTGRRERSAAAVGPLATPPTAQIGADSRYDQDNPHRRAPAKIEEAPPHEQDHQPRADQAGG